MKRLRLRIGVRLMLLLVTLFAVLLASLGLRRSVRQLDARWELWRLEQDLQNFNPSRPHQRTKAQIDGEIAKQREIFGEK
jgi:hypothetical protein